jgi:hypothetical protein
MEGLFLVVFLLYCGGNKYDERRHETEEKYGVQNKRVDVLISKTP